MTEMNVAGYSDRSSSPADRATDLLARMSIDEKLAQLGSVWVFQISSSAGFDADRAGALDRVDRAITPLEVAHRPCRHDTARQLKAYRRAGALQVIRGEARPCCYNRARATDGAPGAPAVERLSGLSMRCKSETIC